MPLVGLSSKIADRVGLTTQPCHCTVSPQFGVVVTGFSTVRKARVSVVILLTKKRN